MLARAGRRTSSPTSRSGSGVVGGRDDAGRARHAPPGGVPLRLRGRPDDAGRRGVRGAARPRRRSTACWRGSGERAGPLPELRPAGGADPPGLPRRRRLRGVPEGARARSRGHRRRGQEGEPPRPGRRRLPDGDEVGLHPAEAHGPRLSRRQRRRGRAGDLQGPLHPRARSPRPDRGDADRGLRDRLPHVLHLHPGRVRPPVAGLPRRPSRRPRPPACWAPTSSARGSTTRWSCTGARAPTSAARRRGSSPPSRARRGGRRSSPRSPRSRAPSASRRSSTTSRRWPRCRTSSRAAGEWFAGLGSKTQGGTRLYSVSGHVARPGVYEASVGITLRELIERAGGVPNGRRLKAVVPGRLLGAAPPGRRDRRDDGRRRAPERGDDGRLGRAWWSWTRPRASPRRSTSSRASTPTSPAGSARPAGSAPAGSTRSRAGSSPARASPRTPTRSWTSPSAGVGSTICAFYDGAIGPYISYVEKFRAEFDHHVRHGACDVCRRPAGGAARP